MLSFIPIRLSAFIRESAFSVLTSSSTTMASRNCHQISTLSTAEIAADQEKGDSTPNTDVVIVEKFGQITTIGINRPEKRNCVNNETSHKLCEAFSTFEEDETALVAVLYGKGGNFCAGFDLQELAGGEGQAEMFQYTIGHDGCGPMGPTRMMLKKPIIAAVSGYAVAGGLELALMCDLRVVEETAVMGVFCRRFGVPLIDGGTVRLPALIGLSRAMDLILTGRAIKGKEAFDFGLANRLVSCGTSLGQAINLASSLLKFPQECMLADRRSAYYSHFSCKDYEDAFNYELENGVPVVAKESLVGAQRFVDGIGKHGKFNLGENPVKVFNNPEKVVTSKL